MASCRACFSRIQVSKHSFLSSSSILFFSNLPLNLPPVSQPRRFTLSACLSTQYSTHDSTDIPARVQTAKRSWKPMCLYYTQGKCTMMDDPLHLEKFNHNCFEVLDANCAKSDKLRPQDVDFLLVLDLEGKVEILEFPVLMIDAKTMEVVDFFHRFSYLSQG